MWVNLLFNKLSGKRASIVDQMEGVTRDRVYSSAEWLSQEFNIIDTEGMSVQMKTYSMKK